MIIERLKSQMSINGITEGELNDEFGRGFYGRLINGCSLTTAEMDKLCKTLNTNREYLYGANISGRSKPAKQYVVKPDILRKRREDIGFTQTALAALIGIKDTYQSAVECEERKRNADFVHALCFYLRCSPEYLSGKTSDLRNGDIPEKLPVSVEERSKQYTSKVSSAKLSMFMHKTNVSPNTLANTFGVGLPLRYIKKAMATDTVMPNKSIEVIAGLLRTEPSAIAPLYKGNTKDEQKPVVIKEESSVKADTTVEAQAKPLPTITTNNISTGNMVDISTLTNVVNLVNKNDKVIDICTRLSQLNDEQLEHVTKTLDYIINGIMVTD